MPIKSKQQPPYYQQGVNVKEYIANLDQIGTSAPIATIFKNTYNTTPILARQALGEYTITTTDEFEPEQTIINNGLGTPYLGNNMPVATLTDQSGITGYYLIEQINESVILIKTYDQTFTPSEWSTLIAGTPILISIQTY